MDSATVTDLKEYKQRHHVEKIARNALEELAKHHAELVAAVGENAPFERLRLLTEKVEGSAKYAKDCVARVTRGSVVSNGDPRR